MELGGYELVGEIGRGGMGVVWRARHQELGHEVALKVIRADEAGPPDLADRFRREIHAAAALRGVPGLVGVRDSGIAPDGSPWLAMDFIAGETLESVAASGELSPPAAAELMATAAEAVHAAHAKGLIHRDLKPANILIDADGAPWVTDFGLVRRTAADPDVTRLTRSGEIVGTPAYMAPEQVMGGAIDARTDVYGLGATLYEVVSGRPPFTGDSMLAVLQDVLNSGPDWRALRDAGGDAGLRRVLESALAKEPGDRYPSAEAFAADLRRWAGGGKVQARVRRQGTGAVLMLTAAGVAVAGAVALAVMSGDGPPGASDGLTVVKAEREAAELAAEAFQAYMRVDRESGAALASLYAQWSGAGRPGGGFDEINWVARTVVEAGAPPPHRRAWTGLAGFLNGREGRFEELESAARLSADDPFPRLLLARAHLARYLAAVELPPAEASVGASAEFVETKEMQALRAVVEQSLRDVRACTWWSLAPRDPFVEQLAVAAAAVADHDFRAAVAAAELLSQNEALAPMAADLSAFARFQSKEYAAAAEGWSALIERMGGKAWPKLHRRAAQARAWQTVKTKDRNAKRPIAEQALYHAGVALRADPGDVHARTARIAANREIGRAIGKRAGLPHLERALADADHLVQHTERSARALHERALTLCSHGLQAWMIPDYPLAERSLARAQADGAALVEAAPKDWRSHSVTALAWQLQVGIDEKKGRDTRPSLRKLLRALEGQLGVQSGLGLQAQVVKFSMQYTLGEARLNPDPRKELQRAEGLLRVYEQQPKIWQAGAYNLGRAWMAWGKRQKNTPGADPTASFMRSAELLGRVPGKPLAVLTRSVALAALVSWEKRQSALAAAHTALALEAAEQARRALPNAAQTHLVRGTLFQDLERWAEALEAYERVLELDPGNDAARRLAGHMRSRLGK